MRCKRDSSASDRSIPFIPIIAKSLSKFPLAYSAIEFRPGARLERLERQGLQSVEGHVRTCVVSRLIKAGRAPLPFQSAANVGESAHRARYRSLFESAAQFWPCNATNRVGWSSHHHHRRGRRWSVPRPETRHYTRVYRAHNPILAGCQSFDVMRPDRPRLSPSFIDAYTPVCARFKRWFRVQRDPLLSSTRIETSIPHRVREIESILPAASWVAVTITRGIRANGEAFLSFIAVGSAWLAVGTMKIGQRSKRQDLRPNNC